MYRGSSRGRSRSPTGGSARPFHLTRTGRLLRRWGISLASLLAGLLTLLVFRRGLPHLGWIVGYLILLWLLAVMLALFREVWEARGWHVPLRGADYAVQSLLHAVLLFILPAYYASTTLTSANVVFLFVLCALAVLATFDPWFRALVQPRRWTRHLFLLVTVFAALNVALPLVRVPPFPATMASAMGAVLALTPMIRHAGSIGWGRAMWLALGAGAVAAIVVGLGRSLIPPAPLALASTAIARSIEGWEPVDPVTGSVSAGELRKWGSLVAYTAIYAPAGLRQPIEHVWRLDGRALTVVRLSAVRGGRPGGFRTYSRKTSFPPDPVGRWSIDVMTGSGQLIGRLSFQVTP
ncbi:MAG: DUF5924 family protein [Candidatus Rokuibacteriota bacterium]